MSNIEQPRGRAGRFFRALTRVLKRTVVLAIVFVAACDISGYVELNHIKKPLIPIPQWPEYKYISQKNPFTHYEIAMRMASDEDIKAIYDSLRTEHPNGRSLTALAHLRPAFAEIHAGAVLSSADLVFPSPTFRDSLGLSMSSLSCSYLCRLSRCLLLDARDKSTRGRTSEAAKELLDGVMLGSHLSNAPDLSDIMLGASASNDSALELLKIVTEGRLTPGELRSIASGLQAADSVIASNTDVAACCYLDERRDLGKMLWSGDSWAEPMPLLGLPWDKKDYKIPESDPTTTWWQDMWSNLDGLIDDCRRELYISTPGYKTAVIRRFDSIWNDEFEAVKKPYVEAIRFDRSKSIPSYDFVNDAMFFRTSFLLPTVENRAVIEGVMLTSAVEAYKKEHGRYPESLQSLVGSYLKKLPTDPYSDGKPFIYKGEGNSYSLYSVGPNGKDDGGKMTDKTHEFSYFSKEDFVFSPQPATVGSRSTRK
jgi:hypothetical protein